VGSTKCLASTPARAKGFAKWGFSTKFDHWKSIKHLCKTEHFCFDFPTSPSRKNDLSSKEDNYTTDNLLPADIGRQNINTQPYPY
jgi:hypothetical protein